VNEKPMLVEKGFMVNAYDIDVMGIVSNIVYIRWFEDLRFGLMDAFWPYEEMLQSGQSPALVKTEVAYKRALTIFDKPLGRLWVTGLTRARWTVAIEIRARDRLCCTGTQTGCFYDINKKRPVPIPEGLMKKYEEAQR
jgi:acyl-CoA thioester hydrolase